jgi:hypothetical protein
MVTLRSPDGRVRCDFALLAGGGAAEAGVPALRVSLGGRRLLGWCRWQPRAAASRPPVCVVARRETRRVLASRRRPCRLLARECRLHLAVAGRPSRRLRLELRCADGGAAFRMVATTAGQEECWRPLPGFPRGAETLVADSAAGGFARRRCAAAPVPPRDLPWTCLYPHGKCAVLLVKAAAPSPWWLLLAGDRPCDLPQAAAVRRLLWGEEEAADAAADRAVAELIAPCRPPQGNEEDRHARFHCLLPFARALSWPESWRWRECWKPAPDAAVTPAHRQALALMAGAENGADAAPWDETLWLRGEMGEYVLAARRRGGEWVAGGIAAAEQVLTLRLDFLAPGTRYRALLLRDAGDRPEGCATEEMLLGAGDKPVVRMARHGGFVLRLTPFAEGAGG